MWHFNFHSRYKSTVTKCNQRRPYHEKHCLLFTQMSRTTSSSSSAAALSTTTLPPRRTYPPAAGASLATDADEEGMDDSSASQSPRHPGGSFGGGRGDGSKSPGDSSEVDMDSINGRKAESEDSKLDVESATESRWVNCHTFLTSARLQYCYSVGRRGMTKKRGQHTPSSPAAMGKRKRKPREAALRGAARGGRGRHGSGRFGKGGIGGGGGGPGHHDDETDDSEERRDPTFANLANLNNEQLSALNERLYKTAKNKEFYVSFGENIILNFGLVRPSPTHAYRSSRPARPWLQREDQRSPGGHGRPPQALRQRKARRSPAGAPAQEDPAQGARRAAAGGAELGRRREQRRQRRGRGSGRSRGRKRGRRRRGQGGGQDLVWVFLFRQRHQHLREGERDGGRVKRRRERERGGGGWRGIEVLPLLVSSREELSIFGIMVSTHHLYYYVVGLGKDIPPG